jgi:hypothetical protein
MNTFGPYSEAQQLVIVKDLLQKRPLGGGDRADITYETESDYCHRYNEWRNFFRCNKVHWGYTQMQIYQLGLLTRGCTERFIEKHFYSGRGTFDMTRGEKAGHSRRVNRVWERIENIRTDIRAGTVPGVYRIVAGRGSRHSARTLGYVIATGGHHATQLGSTLFGAWADGEEIVATHHGYPQVELLQAAAVELQDKLKRRLVKLKEDYDEAKVMAEAEIRAAGMATLIAMDLAEEAVA